MFFLFQLFQLQLLLSYAITCATHIYPKIHDFWNSQRQLMDSETPLFSFTNSSCQFSNIRIVLLHSQFSFISSDSEVTITSTHLYLSNLIPFSCSGKLIVSQLQLTPPDDLQFLSLGHTPNVHGLLSPGSSVSCSSSHFDNVCMQSPFATFLSVGYCNSQTISGCTFNNITVGDAPPLHINTVTLVEEGLLQNTIIHDSCDALQGLIVAGLSDKTLSSFSCSNSSFLRCHRERDSYSLGASLSALLNEEASTTSTDELPPCSMPTEDPSEITADYTSTETCVQSSRVYIHPRTALNITIKYSTFDHCSSSSSGGGLYFNATRTSISVFDETDGDQSVFIMSNCSFSYCSTDGGNGGGFVINRGTATITHCSVSNCTALYVDQHFSSYSFYGGGAYVLNTNDNSGFNHCNFTECKSTHCGGGIYTKDGTSYVQYCKIEQCNSRHGGGIMQDSGSDGTIYECTVTSCEGSGIYIAYKEVTFWYTTISFCSCTPEFSDSGGGLDLLQAKILASDCVISHCSALNGAGVFADKSSATFTRFAFTDCTPDYNGGAVYSTESSITIKNSDITSCTRTSIYLTQSDLYLNNCSLTYYSSDPTSSSSDNGGIYADLYGFDYIHLTNCTFSGFSASWSGGGAHVDMSENCEFKAHECIFARCSSVASDSDHSQFTQMKSQLLHTRSNLDQAGGGVYICGGTAIFDSCQFRDCESHLGGAIYWEPSQQQQEENERWVKNTLFRGNIAEKGGQDVFISIDDTIKAPTESIFDYLCTSDGTSQDVVMINGHYYGYWLIGGSPSPSDDSNYLKLSTLQVVLLVILAIFAFLVMLVLFTGYCCLTGDAQPEEEETRVFLKIASIAGSLVKLVSLINLSFIPKAQVKDNDSSIFSSTFLDSMFSFGKFIFVFTEKYSGIISYFIGIGLLMLLFSILVYFLLAVWLCQENCCSDKHYVSLIADATMNIFCNLLFETIISAVMPSFACTSYRNSEEAESFDDWYLMDPQRSCTAGYNQDFFLLSFAGLMWYFIFFFIFFFRRLCSSSLWDPTVIYPYLFVLFQYFFSIVMTTTAVLVFNKPTIVYLVDLASHILILLFIIFIYHHGCTTLSRRIDFVIYLSSTVSIFISLLSELIPSATIGFSILNLIVIICSIVLFCLVLAQCRIPIISSILPRVTPE